MTKIIGLTAGTFDLLHAGHAEMLRECREHCDILYVCLQADPSIRGNKNVPIQSWFERYLVLQSNRWVTSIFTYKTEDDLLGWIHKVLPDIRFIGEDWKNKEYTGKGNMPKNTKIVFNTRTHAYSTTELRNRVYQAEKLLRKNDDSK